MYDSEKADWLLKLTAQFVLSDVTANNIAEWKDVLRFHEWRYYVLSEPLISDFDYDVLFSKLRNFEEQHPQFITPDSPTQRIATALTEDFPSVQHLAAMLSLENSYNEGDVAEFDRRVKELTRTTEVEYCIEPKFDGASIALVYENDLLQRAATRGDGTMGEEITTNARAINSIPLSAPFSKFGIAKIEIRGEIIITKAKFESINRQRLEAGEKTFQNARNTASGSLRMKNPKEVAERGLEAILYHISYATDASGKNLLGESLKTHDGNIKMLHECGFKTPLNELCVCSSLHEINNFLTVWNEKRHEFQIETDGMVVKVNKLSQQQLCGSTSHHPRWAIAYKFAAKQAFSKLLSVEFQVGRTGAVTPVAKIQPVQLSGVTISSISLHNEEMIKEKNIHINDTVIVERAGEVIPYIAGVVEDLRGEDAVAIKFPATCPSCSAVLQKPDEEAVWRCINTDCPAQIEERLIHFVSKDCMDVEGLGRSIVIDFLQRGYLKSIEDIYRLPFERIVELDGWGEKSIQNLRQSIEQSKHQPLWRLINALGIRHVGASTSKDLASHIQHILDLKKFSLEELQQIEGIGEKVAKSIHDFFQNEGNIHLLSELEQLGVRLEKTEDTNRLSSDKLGGKTFLFTGTLQKFTRDRAKQLVEENGGRLLSGVSANLNYLVAGSDAGSKLAKAQKIPSVTILTEDEFLKMIE